MLAEIALWVAVGLALACGVGLVLLRLLGNPDLAPVDGTLDPKDTLDLVKLSFAVVAGVGGVAALVLTMRRQRVNEAEHRLHQASQQREDTKLYDERYARASKQLGSDKAAVRLAGVYAMASLADDWPDGRQQCIDVLCAYLRMPYTPPADPNDDAAREAAGVEDKEKWRQLQEQRSQERHVRHTIIRVIRDHLRLDAADPRSWQGRDFDFTGSLFDGGDLSDCVFSGGKVSFVRATFADGTVSFRGAKFQGSEVDFSAATFSGAEVDFSGAEISGGEIDLSRAELSDGTVDFSSAIFSGGWVFFIGTTFSGGVMSFVRATFSGCDALFLESTFAGSTVSFRNTTFACGSINFSDARFADGAVDFTNALFSGSEVGFYFGVKFSGSNVDFSGARFTGGEVKFFDAEFSGGTVTFTGAQFAGGNIDLSDPSDNSTPPLFDAEVLGIPPPGLRLPASGRENEEGEPLEVERGHQTPPPPSRYEH